MSSCIHIDNNKFLGEGPTKGFDGTTLIAKKLFNEFYND